MLHTSSSSLSPTNTSSRPFTAQVTSKPAPKMRVQLMHETHPDRTAADAFIRDGFKKAYSADIHVSMPVVIALEKSGFKAALGMRSAKHTLFIEQYLSLPIEKALVALGQEPCRAKIAEIGHLYSNSSNFTLSLLIVTSLLLYKQCYTTMVFTATEQLADLLTKFGLHPSFIAQADPAKLLLSGQYWGSYYDTQPKVMVLKLSDVVSLIASNKLFKVMAEQLALQIESLVSNAKAAA